MRQIVVRSRAASHAHRPGSEVAQASCRGTLEDIPPALPPPPCRCTASSPTRPCGLQCWPPCCDDVLLSATEATPESLRTALQNVRETAASRREHLHDFAQSERTRARRPAALAAEWFR